jgi:hypothetical protein
MHGGTLIPNDGITWRVGLVSDGREEEEKEQVLDLEPDWATPSYGLKVGKRFGLKMDRLLAIRGLYSRVLLPGARAPGILRCADESEDGLISVAHLMDFAYARLAFMQCSFCRMTRLYNKSHVMLLFKPVFCFLS